LLKEAHHAFDRGDPDVSSFRTPVPRKITLKEES